MKQERIWFLIARKLSDEITEAEKEELEVLLKDNLQLINCCEVIAYLWKHDNEEADANAQPVMKLLKRIKKCTDDIY